MAVLQYLSHSLSADASFKRLQAQRQRRFHLIAKDNENITTLTINAIGSNYT